MTPRTSIARLADDAPVPHADSWPARRPPFLQYDAHCADRASKRKNHQLIDNSLCEDCPPIGYPTDKTRCTPCPRRPPSVAYEEEVRASLKEQARKTVRAIIKDRARAYALRPRKLDALHPRLSEVSPRRLVECLRLEIAHPEWHRWFGFGGEVPAINLRGAMLYARWSRRIANRNARRAG